jgi:hypothetical protein
MDASEARAGLTGVCHCRMCQKAGGGPFMAFAGVPVDRLVWTSGVPKIFASSAIAERGFCAECGTPLTYRIIERDRVSVTIGSLDQPAAIAPEMQYGVESRLPWLDRVPALPARNISDFLKLEPMALGSRQHPDFDT